MFHRQCVAIIGTHEMKKMFKKLVFEKVSKTANEKAAYYGVHLSAKSLNGYSDVRKVKIIIRNYAIICAIIATQPLPFADIFLLTPIQVMMGREISRIRGFNYSERDMKKTVLEISGLVGTGYLAQQGIIAAYKTFIPYLGAVTTIPLVFVATYAIGNIIDLYFMKVSDGSYIEEDFKPQAKKVFHLYMMNVDLWADRIGGFLKEKRKPNKDDIESLKKTIADLEESMESMKKDIFDGNYKDINGSGEHNKFMLTAINECEKSIYICSGWVSTAVVDDVFINGLEGALRRGVDVFLVFGYKENKRKHTYLEARERLLVLCSKYPGHLNLIESPIHYKSLVVDKKYYAQGSFNWLSNRRGINIERGTVYFNSEWANKESNFLTGLLPDYGLSCTGQSAGHKYKKRAATSKTKPQRKEHVTIKSKTKSTKEKNKDRQIRNKKQGKPVNAGLPWADDLKKRLKKDYKSGRSVKELAKRFGRTELSIMSQLERQGLLVREGKDKSSLGERTISDTVLDVATEVAPDSMDDPVSTANNRQLIDRYLEALNESKSFTLSGIMMACRREKAKHEKGSSKWKEIDEACRYLQAHLKNS